MSVYFHNEDVRFQLKHKNKLKRWLRSVAAAEAYAFEALNFVFCSDEKLKQINNEYLSHDHYTDVITFDNSDDERSIEGDIFISIDRVKDNAMQEGVDFDTELRRVMVHGLLHLMGYKDKAEADQQEMRMKEDEALASFTQ